MIDGKGGDDIIFGGDGDDVIIGGEGDDVILSVGTRLPTRMLLYRTLLSSPTLIIEVSNFDRQLSHRVLVEVMSYLVVMELMTLIVVKAATLYPQVVWIWMDDGEADFDIVKDFMENNNIDNKDIFDNDDWV